MTTIEFCEKSLPKKEAEPRNYDTSVYDIGLYGNVRAVLGSNVLFWLLPCSRPAGDGLDFVSDLSRLTKGIESSKGTRRRTHQTQQRSVSRGRYGESLGPSYYSSLSHNRDEQATF